MTIQFENSYAALPERFYTAMGATPVENPAVFAINAPLAEALGLDVAWLKGPEGLALLSGNGAPETARPLAQVYAGHQFGGWSPQLGDGRALLVGELRDQAGQVRDVQLKGSGPTPYSRMGDGRAWLGPVIREYLVSEAMHALGIPTTRALAAVTTGEPVYRERALPGAILTRVAASHVRVGTFQYFAARKDTEALQQLADFAIARHYPTAETPLHLLRNVVEAQAALIANWMAVGFIHGVMNTDNMTISGETIDYGPCAFMDAFDQAKVFSSIDQFGRYAYNRQAEIALWNLAQLASALLPVIDADQNRAIELAGPELNRFSDLFQQNWLRLFRAKLGLTTPEDGDEALIAALLGAMQAGMADFTNTFRALGTDAARDEFLDPARFDAWQAEWAARLAREGATPAQRATDMARVNPAVIPRNHLVERAISEAVEGDRSFFDQFHTVLATPFATPEDSLFTRTPAPAEEVRQTFCGT